MPKGMTVWPAASSQRHSLKKMVSVPPTGRRNLLMSRMRMGRFPAGLWRGLEGTAQQQPAQQQQIGARKMNAFHSCFMSIIGSKCTRPRPGGAMVLRGVPGDCAGRRSLFPPLSRLM